MNVRHATALILSFCFFEVALGAASQSPGGPETIGGPVHVASAPHPKPTNLKVLPKDMSGDDVDKLMHRYQQYLGVPCGYCHEENPQTKEIDYASDENPLKETARFMISMTSDINNKYLAQLGDRRYAEPLTCGNCHRGQLQPPPFELKTQQ
ncbi:c-type cytochrome [Granulicella sp. L60]|uniref:c-type cytochrome n=1 Tax=Granulicella sp. L60 TaxID=1641866 RepID=UPI00131D00F9|nr:c-type cytochrome [Granulicella sp. L60]